ncbi:MAG: TolC family protein [Chitinophagaceae bacterium]|nr:TolC family protein [Chitinophagaceae bacterium]
MKAKVLLMMCISAVTGFSTLHAQDIPSRLTLKACLDIALANNIPVKQSELLEQNARLNLNQSRMNRLPNVSASLNYGINNGRSIDPYTNSYINQQLSSSNSTLTASVPVFKGFQMQNSIQQASYNYQASKMELQQEKDNLTLNAILAFLQVMNDEDVLALTKKQTAVTEKQAERLELLNREGAIAPAVLYDMKGQYASDQLAVINAGRALEMSKLTLAQYMNVPYDKNIQADREGFDLKMELYETTADNIYAAALQNLAFVKAADLRTRAASKAIRVAAADLYPTLSLFGQLGTNFSSAARTSSAIGTTDVVTGDYVVVNGANSPVISKQTNYNSRKIDFFKQYNNNLGTFFGVSLQVPVFSSFQSRTKVKQARLEEKRTGYVAENTRIQLRQAIEQAHLNMTTAWNRYKVLGEQVTAFEESFRAAEIRFNLGAMNSVEYLIVKNNFDRATINFTSARYDYLLRTRVLDFYQGRSK